MQDLKFRVYNKKEKMWYDSEFLILCNGEVYADARDFEDGIALNPDDIHVMQYTGLRDDNNIYLCEGDVIKICWSDLIGESHWDDLIIKNPFDYSVEEAIHLLNINELKLLGNIYDNPERGDKGFGSSGEY